ncbi:ribokinase [Pyxidicoccus fallax]|uniref:Ribokinase n=1 Tax=Pyxidicoccus fallax TaxID=394095 RepID=A0A848LG02_9BACT|nr:ribokinase [Pyxidicoccus fallax]NMO16153.1 ribokinase [Pyxidicoccus fallax]NPC78706.1 ribokinase [Pyxidicoccus fallax]
MAAEEQADIVVVGGISTDFLVQGPRLPGPGDRVEGHLFLESLGGKGANGAVGAARLGARVALIGRVGMDARGLALLEQLEGEGVDIRSVGRDAGEMTGVVLEMVDEAGRTQSLASPGANHCMKVADVMRAEERITAARVLLAQLEVPLDVVSAAVHIARAAGTRVVLDPAPAMDLPEDLLEAIHVIRPNAKEAEALTGVEVRDRDSARRAAENLLRRGVGGAVVASPDGSLVLWSEGELWLPDLALERADTTGAGDAFSAALAVAIAEGESLTEAARFAHEASALATLRLGALGGLPTRDQVESRLARLGPSGEWPESPHHP